MSRTAWILLSVGIGTFVLAISGATLIIGLSSEQRAEPDETLALGEPAPGLELPLANDPSALMLARRSGRVLVGVAVVPRRSAEIAVVEGETAVPRERLTFTLGSRRPATRSCGYACWRLAARPAQLVVSVRGGPALRFELPRHLPPSGRALFAKVERAMSALRTYRYEEHLTSGVGEGVTSTFDIQAPDRARVQAGDGFQSVIIDNTRWDLHNGRWEQTSFPGFLATYMWDGATNPRLLRRAVVRKRPVRVLSVFDREPVPAWFELFVHEPTGRVLLAKMLAPSHFMAQEFSGFNAPNRIEPPA